MIIGVTKALKLENIDYWLSDNIIYTNLFGSVPFCFSPYGYVDYNYAENRYVTRKFRKI